MLIDVFLFFLCLFATYRSGGAKGPGIFFIIPCTDSYQKVRAVISTIILLVLVMIIITDSNTNAMNRLYFSKSICLFNCSKHKPCIFFSVVQQFLSRRACGGVDVGTCPHQVLAATLTLSQPGGQIMPTLYTGVHTKF